MPIYHVRQRTPPSAVIAYLHDGGHIVTAISAHTWLVDHLTRKTGADVVMPLYPLALHRTQRGAYWPMLELCRRAVAQNPGKRIVLVGDSTGGGLVTVIALSLAEVGDAQPDKLVLISPWVDIIDTNLDIADYVDANPLMAPEPLAEVGRSWAGSAPPTDWYLSPIYGDLSGLKKVTTFMRTREILLPNNAFFHAELLETGMDSTLHVGKNLNHVYPMFPTPKRRRVRRDLVCFVIDKLA